MEKYSHYALIAVGTVGSSIMAMYGGWNEGMTFLALLMLLDYITGIIVAGWFNNSTKTENGALSSRVGFQGLFRKGMIMVMVLVGAQVDIQLKLNMIKDAVIITYILNEMLSLLENAGLMGIPIPEVLKKAIEIFKIKAGAEIPEILPGTKSDFK